MGAPQPNLAYTCLTYYQPSLRRRVSEGMPIEAKYVVLCCVSRGVVAPEAWVFYSVGGWGGLVWEARAVGRLGGQKVRASP